MVNFSWDRVDGAFLKGLPGWVSAQGLRCEALGAYVNCVSPGVVLMGTRAEDFERAIGYAAQLRCTRLVAWTGSHSLNLMQADARNSTRESEDALVRFLEGHLGPLEKAALKLALETYVTLTCPDAAALRRVLARLPALVGAVLDPPNMTPVARYAERDQVLVETMTQLKGRIEVVHLKDFRLAADGKGYELPGPLGGVMNYPLYAQQIAALPEDVPVAAEHIGPDQYQAVRDRLLRVFDRT
jgi:sugar phosphate isomerase/epimerase